MKLTAFVTGADHGLGFGIVLRLLQMGWKVYAGKYKEDWTDLETLKEQYPYDLITVPLDVTSDQSARDAAKRVESLGDHIDLLVNNAGVNTKTVLRTIEEPQDYDEMIRLYNTNALGPLRVVEAFLPLMEGSGLKRLCFVSSEAGSINACERNAWFGYCTSKAALNMAVRILFNKLRPAGFTFRLYHPGYVRSYIRGYKNTDAELEPELAGIYAVEYFTRSLNVDIGNPGHSDENRLVLRDWKCREYPW